MQIRAEANEISSRQPFQGSHARHHSRLLLHAASRYETQKFPGMPVIEEDTKITVHQSVGSKTVPKRASTLSGSVSHHPLGR